MCTITYLPYNDGYILTQNRDESPLRADAIFPLEDEVNGQRLIYPQDPEGSGSWFVSTKDGITLCVMNGAYHPDKKDGDYRHSRGLVPLHYLEFNDPQAFLKEYHFRELEAFDLLVCSAEGVIEFVWDETNMMMNRYTSNELIFQSAPLYDLEQKQFRKGLFQTFLDNNHVTDILNFHTQKQTDDPALDILMDRGPVGSVSTVQRRFHKSENHVGYLKKGDSEVQFASF